MKLLPFVCGSSAILAIWLLVTFLHDVPSHSYRTPEGPDRMAAAKGSTEDAAIEIATAETEEQNLAASLSN